MLSKRTTIKIIIIALLYTILYWISNSYFKIVNNEAFLDFITSLKFLPEFTVNLLVFFLVFYLAVLFYKGYVERIKSNIGKSFLSAGIMFGIVLIIVLLRYILLFTASRNLLYFLAYSGLESFIFFPIQLIMLIPTLIFGFTPVLEMFAAFLGYIGILFMPLIWAIGTFILTYIYEAKIRKE